MGVNMHVRQIPSNRDKTVLVRFGEFCQAGPMGAAEGTEQMHRTFSKRKKERENASV